MLIRTPAASSTAALATPATTAAAPWRALFLQHLSQMPMPLCAVSTLHPANDERSVVDSSPIRSSAHYSTITTPRVRNCVCRGLWGSLPENSKNPAPRNPAIYESDLPVFTTDARMAKAWEISASAPTGTAVAMPQLGEGATRKTGGGGPIEAVWWASEAGTQWRVRGTAWVLGPDVDGPAGAAARDAIQTHMRRVAVSGGDLRSNNGSGSAWSWSREITAHFGNMSPGMRGSFRNPPPGQPRPPRGKAGNMRPGEGMGLPVDNDHLDDEAARANFRVCVIVPNEVDQVDLSNGDDPRRWLYRYVGDDWEDEGKREEDVELINGWTKLEVWP